MGRRSARDGTAAGEFQELMLPHIDAAYNLARFLSRNPAAADDIVQEAFLRAFRGFDGFRGGDAKSWLLAIVRNCSSDWAKSSRDGADCGAAELDELPDPAQDTPESAVMRSSEVAQVRALIDSLPEPFRETLVLRELEDLSYKQIAAITGVPIGTVMSRLARARQLLSGRLEVKS